MPIDGSPWDLAQPETFSQVFHLTHLPVFHYLYGLTCSPLGDVEDLLAETYTRAWQSRRQFRGDETTVLFWLLRIARNQVLDAYRRKKARGSPSSLEEEEAETIPDGVPGPEQALIDGERRLVIWRLFQNLSEEGREMLTLRYVLDWQVKQIAAYTRKGETAVSMAIHRALKRLQEEAAKTGWMPETLNKGDDDVKRSCSSSAKRPSYHRGD